MFPCPVSENGIPIFPPPSRSIRSIAAIERERVKERKRSRKSPRERLGSVIDDINILEHAPATIYHRLYTPLKQWRGQTSRSGEGGGRGWKGARGRKSDNISTGYVPRNARVASRRGPRGPQNNAPCLLRDCGYIRSDARIFAYTGCPEAIASRGTEWDSVACEGSRRVIKQRDD